MSQPSPHQPEISKLVQTGVSLCRQRSWTKGLQYLGYASRYASGASQLPAKAMAYLGYGEARFLKHASVGLDLCRQAVESDLFDPETYLLLARTQLFLGDRRAAVATIDNGLLAAPGDQELGKLRRKMGFRKAPIFSFLPRSHPANRMLGALRHSLTRKR